MINLNFNLRWPCSNRFRNIWCRHWNTPWQYKFVEAQVYASADILDFFIRHTSRQSHAGLYIGIGLFGYNFEFQFYDSRHWDYEQGKWQETDTVL